MEFMHTHADNHYCTQKHSFKYRKYQLEEHRLQKMDKVKFYQKEEDC